jgi:hypothetical protein
MAGDVFIENRNVSAGDLEVEMPEQYSADMDGRPLLTRSVANSRRKSWWAK